MGWKPLFGGCGFVQTSHFQACNELVLTLSVAVATCTYRCRFGNGRHLLAVTLTNALISPCALATDKFLPKATAPQLPPPASSPVVTLPLPWCFRVLITFPI